MRIRLPNFAIFIGFMIAWHMIFSFFELYHSRRLSSVHEEVADIIKATCAGAVVLLVGCIHFQHQARHAHLLTLLLGVNDLGRYSEPCGAPLSAQAAQEPGP